MNAVETIEYKGLKIEIHQDEDPDSPRNWDNLGTIIYWHRRYLLGDQNGQKEFGNAKEFLKWAKEKEALMLPIYLYDHSGITISTGAFSCPWDSGQVDWIYVLPEKIRQEYSCKRITKVVRERAMKVLQAEIQTFDEYLQGEVYGYMVMDDDWEHIDSCWGYFGSDKDYMIQCAKEAIDDHIERMKEQETLCSCVI